MISALPDIALPSVEGAAIRLPELLATSSTPVLLVFVHADCPTSTLALARLGPLAESLRDAGVSAVFVAEEPIEVAARLARRHGITGTMLSEPRPYAASRFFGIEAVPTAVLVAPDGSVLERVVGWSKDELDRILPVEVPGDEPRWKPGCEARTAHDDHGPVTAFDELEDMFERGWTDGLPVMPPTPERVEAMLGGHDPERVLGPVPPAMGEATLARVAACAVLAGCRPEYFPVVLAAVEGILDPAFNVHGQAVTTSPPGQILIVNGPVRAALGLNSGMGALGPGWRANLTIGRAVRLVVHLTGGGAPGGLDRATLGHPGKLSFCIAEDEEGSPWEPLHVERGFPRETSTVTLLAGDSPLSVSDHDSKTPEELAAVFAWAGAATWSPFWWPLDETSLFLVGGEHQKLFAQAGWSKRDLSEAIYEAACRPARELNRGETTPIVRQADPDEPIHKWTSPDRIMIVAAGGEAGRFSAVIGPCLGMQAALITREVPS
jgi:hypothetical protein